MNLNAKNRIKQAKRHAAEADAEIRRLVRDGHWRKARGRRRKYLGSSCAHITAVSQANAKLPKHRRRSRETVLAVAAALNPWHGTREPVKVFPVRKGSGGHRPIMDFGLRNRALQYLARAAAEPFAQLHPGQYALRGTQSAIRDLLHAMNDHHHVTVTDIRDAYGSFDADAVVRLVPLPRVVAQRILVSRDLNLVFKHKDLNSTEAAEKAAREAVEEQVNPFEPSLAKGVCTALALESVAQGNEGHDARSSPYMSYAHGQFMTSARRGIPQGSAVSALVCEMLLAPVMRALPAETRVVSYADDIAMPARTKAEAQRNDLDLGRALRCSPAGPLTEKYCRTTTTEHGFAFLGYWLDTKRGAPRARPTHENLAKFETELERHYYQIMEDIVMWRQPNPAKIKEMLRYARSWANSFSCWLFARAYVERQVRNYFELPPATGSLRVRLLDHLAGLAAPRAA